MPIGRVDRLLRAAVALPPDWRVQFLFVGAKELHEIASKEPRTLEDTDRWAAFCRDILCVSDVAVLTSDSEGTPLSHIDPSAGGLPIVTPGIPVAAAALPAGATGHVVVVDDESALSRALTSLAGDLELRQPVGGAPRRHGSASFFLAPQISDIDALCTELLRGRSA